MTLSLFDRDVIASKRSWSLSGPGEIVMKTTKSLCGHEGSERTISRCQQELEFEILSPRKLSVYERKTTTEKGIVTVREIASVKGIGSSRSKGLISMAMIGARYEVAITALTHPDTIKPLLPV